MDWLKIKPGHITYSTMDDALIGALMRIRCQVATMERIPTEEEMLKVVHHKRLKALKEAIEKEGMEVSRNAQGMLKECPRSLHEVLIKDLEDVQGVVIKRGKESLRKSQGRDTLRTKIENVPRDNVADVPRTRPQDGAEQRRVEKSREEEKKEIPLQSPNRGMGETFEIENLSENPPLDPPPIDPATLREKDGDYIRSWTPGNAHRCFDCIWKIYSPERRGNLASARNEFFSVITSDADWQKFKTAFTNYRKSDEVNRDVVKSMKKFIGEYENWLEVKS